MTPVAGSMVMPAGASSSEKVMTSPYATSASSTGLTLDLGQTYFCSVRAYDSAGNVG